MIQSKASNIFSCDGYGPARGIYACSACDRLTLGGQSQKGCRRDLNGLTVEVLETDASGMPSQVAFRFSTSLDSPDFHWLRFDLQTALASRQSYQPFKIPPSVKPSPCPPLPN